MRQEVVRVRQESLLIDLLFFPGTITVKMFHVKLTDESLAQEIPFIHFLYLLPASPRVEGSDWRLAGTKSQPVISQQYTFKYKMK